MQTPIPMKPKLHTGLRILLPTQLAEDLSYDLSVVKTKSF